MALLQEEVLGKDIHTEALAAHIAVTSCTDDPVEAAYLAGASEVEVNRDFITAVDSGACEGTKNITYESDGGCRLQFNTVRLVGASSEDNVTIQFNPRSTKQCLSSFKPL